jgi:hypothetical protein
MRRSEMVQFQLSGVAWSHLHDTSPGCLTDEELSKWGYEDAFADYNEAAHEEFTRVCRDAVRGPVARRRYGRFGSQVTLEVPSLSHAAALLSKLLEVGEEFAEGGGGYDEETHAEGRQMVAAARKAMGALGLSEAQVRGREEVAA